ncbi:MAG: DNA polymerase I [Endomicrobia bacterium]|nr:DNA polymerase I [Endomicrobiia bacterium]MDW8055198.1 DNA polymerase I [Elusimicrobiota bacterium]
MEKNKIFLVDGNAYIHRAFHAIPLLTTSSGLPINATYGFVRMIFKTLKNFKPLYFCICLDSDKPTFRHKMYKEYKGTRKELDENIKIQFPIVNEFIQLSGIPYLRYDGYEADDIICSLVHKFKKDYEIVIISGDKDILQLVDENIVVYNEHKDIWYRVKDVEEKYGVKPSVLGDYFALIGDKVDNIAGIPGIGPKTAAELLNKFATIDGIYENLDSIKPELKEKFLKYKDELYRSMQLVKLNAEIEYVENVKIDDLKMLELNVPQIKQFLIKYEMKSIIKELDKVSDLQDLKSDNKKEYLLNLLIEKKKNEITVAEETVKIFYADNHNIDSLLREIDVAEKVIIMMLGKENENSVIGYVGIAVSANTKKIFYLPTVSHITLEGKMLSSLDRNIFIKFITTLFFEQNKKIVTYDIKSQLVKLKDDFEFIPKINYESIYDIHLLAHLIEPNKKMTKIQDLVDIFYPGRIIADNILQKEFNPSLFPVEKLVTRMVDTVEIIDEIYKKINDELQKYNLYEPYRKLELPLVTILAKMEQNGIKVDLEYIKSLKDEFEIKISQLKNEIYKIADLEFNLNSPKQLAFVLFEKLKLPPVKKKKTGYSTDEEVLQRLRDVHPVIPLILQYRELEKLRSTYVDPIEKYVNSKTQRIHTIFNPVGTATGRISSEEPNMQNIPVKTELGKKIRQMFIPETNYKFVSMDYSQIELRILAHFSMDDTLIASFEKNKDIHVLTACEIFGINEDEVNDNIRRTAKVINFGIIYGMTPQGLSKELGIPVELADEYIKRYFDRYPKVKQWIQETIKFVKINGYVKTLLGRIRPIPEISSSNKQLVSFGERLAVNTPIQGTAADIIKLAMIEIDKFIETNGLDDKVKILLQIHDELLFEIHTSVLNDAVQAIKKIMETIVELRVPIVVDVAVFNRWGEN